MAAAARAEIEPVRLLVRGNEGVQWRKAPADRAGEH